MMDRNGMHLRMWIAERADLYTLKYGEFSTTDIWHFLDVEHTRHAPTLKETRAILGIMPEMEHTGRDRWRYSPQRIPEDEQSIIMVCIMASGAIPVCALQDKYGQEAVRLAERNGTIRIDEYYGGAEIEGGWASLTELGAMRARGLWGAVA
ncbi:MAG: hypothetical protein IKE76_04020 [Clostridia bacterium]|nr:hypothetical protein [Clostridia bacterium]